MSKDSTIKTIVFANDHTQQKITSQDVAKLAGVSQSAVSRECSQKGLLHQQKRLKKSKMPQKN